MSHEDKVWWFESNGKKYGPYSAKILKALAVRGKITSSDLIWKDGTANWIPASSVNGLISPSRIVEAPPSRENDDRKQVSLSKIANLSLALAFLIGMWFSPGWRLLQTILGQPSMWGIPHYKSHLLHAF